MDKMLGYNAREEAWSSEIISMLVAINNTIDPMEHGVLTCSC